MVVFISTNLFSDVFKFETSQTGWLSATPYLAMAIVLQVAGHIADWILRKGLMSRTNIRKLFNCGAFISQVLQSKELSFFSIFLNFVSIF